MNHEQIRILMMDRLYGTLSEDDQAALDQALRSDHDLQREWEEVQATHLLYQSVPQPVADASMTSAILDQAKRPASSPHIPWMRAAAVLVVVCIGGLLWSQSDRFIINPSSNIAATIDPIPYRGHDFGAAHQTQSSPAPKTASTTHVTQELRSTSAQLITDTNESAVDEAKAEELFRTGLANYNLAFTKVGDEKETLLKSAIISLRDVQSEFPKATDWVALALMLIADAHRELENIDEAIDAYQVVLDTCSDRESFCQKARLSALQLMVHDASRRDEAIHIAETLVVQDGLSDESATTLLTLAKQIIETHQTQVFAWMDSITQQWSASHAYSKKASQLRTEAQVHWIKANAIRDWVRTPQLPIDSNYMQVVTKKGRFGMGSENHHVELFPIPWEPVHLARDLFNLRVPDSRKNLESHTRFYQTYVYSPKERTCLAVVLNPHYVRYRLNDNNLLDGIDKELWVALPKETRNRIVSWNGSHDNNHLSTNVITLQEGWNHLVTRIEIIPENIHYEATSGVAFMSFDESVPKGLFIGAADHPDRLKAPQTISQQQTHSGQSQSNPSPRMEVNP